MLNRLHADGIEIVPPAFMNQRPLDAQRRFIPEAARPAGNGLEAKAEEIAFDKANEAASAEEPRNAIAAIDEQIDAAGSEDASPTHDVDRLKARKDCLLQRLAAADEQRKAEDGK